jgi:GNAT superfamily N-acetyltransferase
MAEKQDPENVTLWIARPDNSVLVAVENGTIRAVGAVTDAGEVTLNYVSPGARFRGVSRALLSALETRAAERGNTRCTLTSTETTRRFYPSQWLRRRQTLGWPVWYTRELHDIEAAYTMKNS